MFVAAVTFVADYKLGWDATKAATFWAVFIYFALNGALTLWIWGVEKSMVYSGQHDGVTVYLLRLCVACALTDFFLQLSISSSVAKHTPIYNLIVRYQNSSGKEEQTEISSRFTRWFDHDGFFVAKPFQQWLASEIPAVGQADPANAGPAKFGIADENGTAGSTDSPESTPRKRGRPRKGMAS